MDRRKRNKGIALMALCAGLWSIAGIFIKLVPWNPVVIAGARSFVAMFVVAGYMAVTKTKCKVNRHSLLAGVMLCVTFLSFVTANKLTTAANAIVLQFTSPVFIMIISAVFYKQRFLRSDYMVVALTLLGISLCFMDQLDGGGLTGNLIAILAGLFLAVMYVVTGNADSDSRMTGILLGHLLTALVGLPMALVFPTPVTTGAVTGILILGVVQLGIPYVLYGIAVGNCSPLVCSLVGAVEPLLNPVWVFLFDGERPGPMALAGGLVVVATITVWCVWSDRASRRREQTA